MRTIIIRIVFLIPTKHSMAGIVEFHLSHCARSVCLYFRKTLYPSHAHHCFLPLPRRVVIKMSAVNKYL